MCRPAENIRIRRTARLLRDALVELIEERGWAEQYAAALTGSADPAAAGWAEALEWFAERTKGGQLSLLVHQDFVARFSVDPDVQGAPE